MPSVKPLPTRPGGKPKALITHGSEPWTGMQHVVAPDVTSPRFKANPYPFYARLRAEAPVYRTRLAGRGTAWLVTRYDDVVDVLRDERFAKDRCNAVPPKRDGRRSKGSADLWVPGFLRPLERNMLDLDAPDHTRLRALAQQAFPPRRVEQLRGQAAPHFSGPDGWRGRWVLSGSPTRPNDKG